MARQSWSESKFPLVEGVINIHQLRRPELNTSGNIVRCLVTCGTHPEEALVLAGLSGGIVFAFALTTGRLVAIFTLSDGSSKAIWRLQVVAPAPAVTGETRNHTLYGASSNRTVQRWEFAPADLKKLPTGQEAPSIAATRSYALPDPVWALHADATTIFAGAKETLYVIDASSGHIWKQVHLHPGGWITNVWHVNGTVFTASTDKLVKSTNLNDPNDTRSYEGNQRGIQDLLVIPKYRTEMPALLLTSAGDGLVCIFTLEDAVLIKRLRSHEGPVPALAYDPHLSALFSAGDDTFVMTRSLKREIEACFAVGEMTSNMLQQEQDQKSSGAPTAWPAFKGTSSVDALRHFSWQDSGGKQSLLLVALRSGEIWILDMSVANPLRNTYRHHVEPNAIGAVTEMGTTYLVSGSESEVKLMELQTRQQVLRFPAVGSESQRVLCLAMHTLRASDMLHILIGVAPSELLVMRYDLQRHEVVSDPLRHHLESPPSFLQLAGTAVYIGCVDGSVCKLSHDAKSILAYPPSPVRLTIAGMSVSGGRLFACSIDEVVRVLTFMEPPGMSVWQNMQTQHKNDVNCVLACAGRLYTGSNDATIHIYDVLSDGSGLRHVQTLTGHTLAVLCLQLDVQNASDPTLFSGSSDRTVKCWSLSSGSCIHSFRYHSSGVRSLSLLGKYLYSTALDGTIRVVTTDGIKKKRQLLDTLRSAPDSEVLDHLNDLERGYVRQLLHLCAPYTELVVKLLGSRWLDNSQQSLLNEPDEWTSQLWTSVVSAPDPLDAVLRHLPRSMREAISATDLARIVDRDDSGFGDFTRGVPSTVLEATFGELAKKAAARDLDAMKKLATGIKKRAEVLTAALEATCHAPSIWKEAFDWLIAEITPSHAPAMIASSADGGLSFLSSYKTVMPRAIENSNISSGLLRALSTCCQRRAPEYVKRLLNHGADFAPQDLHLFPDLGIDWEYTTDAGYNLMHLATINHNTVSAEYLYTQCPRLATMPINQQFSHNLHRTPRHFATDDNMHAFLRCAETELHWAPQPFEVDMVVLLSKSRNLFTLDVFQLLTRLRRKNNQQNVEANALEVQTYFERKSVAAFVIQDGFGDVFVLVCPSTERLRIEAERTLGLVARFAGESLSASDRQSFLRHIMQCPRSKFSEFAEPDGAKDDQVLEEMKVKGEISDYFPLHDRTELHRLHRYWGRFEPVSSILRGFTPEKWRRTSSAFFDPKADADEDQVAVLHRFLPYKALFRLRQYIGDRVAWYFAFMSFYVAALMVLAVPCLVLTVLQFGSGSPASIVLLITSTICLLWAFLLVRCWQRKESEIAANFQTDDWESWEMPSLDFIHRNRDLALACNPITGVQEPVLTGLRKTRPRVCMTAVVILAILAAIAFLMTQLQTLRSGSRSRQWVAGVIIALIQIILEFLYRAISAKLTEFENHRTTSAEEASEAFKNILFALVGQFFPLFWILFNRSVVSQSERTSALQIALVTLVATKTATSLAVEKVGPFLFTRFRQRHLGLRITPSMAIIPQERGRAGSVVSHEELVQICRGEALKPEAGSLFQDYSLITVEFGYVVCFATVLPSLSLFMAVASFIELRGDLFKFTTIARRPNPGKASGIGVWLRVWDALTFAAIPINAGIIFFFGSDWEHAWSYALAYTLALLAAKVAVNTVLGPRAQWVVERDLKIKYQAYTHKETTKKKDKELPASAAAAPAPAPSADAVGKLTAPASEHWLYRRTTAGRGGADSPFRSGTFMTSYSP